jgi:CRP/FNR family transcriptional regulator, cyclic AMP receptor protein
VHRIDFEQVRSRHPAIDRMLVQALAQQLQRMNRLLSEAFYETAERRVLRRLLELGAADEHAIRITQDHLAALAGASRATVNAVLAAERRRGTIEVRRGETLLLDHAALARRAGLHPSER